MHQNQALEDDTFVGFNPDGSQRQDFFETL